jgi:hypothetical protein
MMPFDHAIDERILAALEVGDFERPDLGIGLLMTPAPHFLPEQALEQVLVERKRVLEGMA